MTPTPAQTRTADNEAPPASSPAGKSTFSSGRRWGARFHTVASVILVVYIAVTAIIIAYRHPVRYDLTEEGLFSISDETRAKLDLVREEIRVIVAYHYQPGNAQHAATASILQRALDLLKEYNAYQPLVSVVDKVNVFHEPDRWAGLCKQYGLAPSQFNRIIFLAGADGELQQSVSPNDLASLEPAPDPSRVPRIRQFRGATAISGAILRLVERERKIVYFTRDHGELPLESEPGRPAMLGALRRDLAASGYEARELSLEAGESTSVAVPADCDLLVVAGPQRRFSLAELDAIQRYLDKDGRLLVALGSGRTGIEDVLSKWGVEVQDGVLATRIVVPGQQTVRDWVGIARVNGAHAVTQPFVDVPHFGVELLTPRPLRIIGGQRSFLSESLLSSPRDSESRRTFLHRGDDASLRDAEKNGAFTLAAVTRPEKLERPPPGWVERKTRLIVVGAASFLRDYESQTTVYGGYQSFSHRDFFIHCVHWLTGEENLISDGGVETGKRQLPRLAGGLQRFLFVSCVLIFPGIFALVGIGVYFLRRS